MDINKPDLPKAEGLFDRIIQFSINNAIWVMMFVIAWIGVGIYSYQNFQLMLCLISPMYRYKSIVRPMVLQHQKLSKGSLIRLRMPCLVFQIWSRLVQFPDMVFLRSPLSLKMVLTFTGQGS